MKRLVLLIAAFCLAAALSGNAAQAAGWTIDPAKSTLGFLGKQSGTAFEGHFAKWQADIDFDPNNPASGHVLVTIDMASATTGDAQKDQSLPQSDWFGVASFPKAIFEATSFRAKGGDAFEAPGTLSIRGVKKDVVLPFTFEAEGNTGHAKGKFVLLRTDYGVGQGEWASGQIVAIDVGVTFDIRATR